MATLLEGVNVVLGKVGALNNGELTTLTDSSIQRWINVAVDAWNDVIDDLYELTPRVRPNAIKSSTITLVQGQREYALHSNLVKIRTEYHLIDETNNDIIEFQPDAHQAFTFSDIEVDDVGNPHLATLNPENGRLLLDKDPAADDAGKVYKYRYEKDLELTDATDEFPFANAVYRALRDATTEKWKFEIRNEGNQEVYDRALARAAAKLTKMPKRMHWGYKHVRPRVMDPFHGPVIR